MAVKTWDGVDAPAEHADRSDMPTQAEVNAEIDREDDMDSSADAPDPDKRD